MFQPGELVVYGTTGVCRVESITTPDMHGADRNKTYYQLRPLQQGGLIYIPVDNPKVTIRPVITREEALTLIDQIPSIHVEVCRTPTLQALAQQYQAAIHSGNCLDLIKMLMSIHIKQQHAEAQNRRLGMVDERYMKQAERLLHGELAAALEIPVDEVPSFISQYIQTNFHTI